MKVKAYCLLSILCVSLSKFVWASEVPTILRTDLPPPELTAKTWILMDFQTGWILASKDADTPIEPASLSKILTTYVVFKEIENGNIKLDDMVHVSKKAWKTGGSRMFIEVDTKVSVADLLRGVIVQSGNDAAVALAEHVAGSEDAFATRMNEYGKKLGLTNSNFTNAPGLPEPNNYSSARDLSVITAALIREFPEYYKWYAEKEFTYNEITQPNRNKLLYRDPTADGVKTGYTKSAGYCLVGSAQRDGMRLIAAVTGTKSGTRRTKEVQTLLTYGFSSYKAVKLAEAGNALKQIKVYMGDQKQVGVGVTDNLYFIAPRAKESQIKTKINAPNSIIAPVSAGQELATLDVMMGDEQLTQYPLGAIAGVGEGSWWEQAIDYVLLWFE